MCMLDRRYAKVIPIWWGEHPSETKKGITPLIGIADIQPIQRYQQWPQIPAEPLSTSLRQCF